MVPFFLLKIQDKKKGNLLDFPFLYHLLINLNLSTIIV